jgi:hypothetical protein
MVGGEWSVVDGDERVHGNGLTRHSFPHGLRQQAPQRRGYTWFGRPECSGACDRTAPA